MHTINTFLFGGAVLSKDEVYRRVRQYYESQQGVEIDELWRPFGMAAALRVTVDQKYCFTVSVIDDDSVRESVSYVEGVTSVTLPVDSPVCEVRTTFGDDKNSDFDHITVSMYEFLEALPGAIVYDENHKEIVSGV